MRYILARLTVINFEFQWTSTSLLQKMRTNRNEVSAQFVCKSYFWQSYCIFKRLHKILVSVFNLDFFEVQAIPFSRIKMCWIFSINALTIKTVNFPFSCIFKAKIVSLCVMRVKNVLKAWKWQRPLCWMSCSLECVQFKYFRPRFAHKNVVTRFCSAQAALSQTFALKLKLEWQTKHP